MHERAAASCANTRVQLEGLRDLVRVGGLKNLSRYKLQSEYESVLDIMINCLAGLEVELRCDGPDRDGDLAI
jgi:hypothetical protein